MPRCPNLFATTTGVAVWDNEFGVATFMAARSGSAAPGGPSGLLEAAIDSHAFSPLAPLSRGAHWRPYRSRRRCRNYDNRGHNRAACTPWTEINVISPALSGELAADCNSTGRNAKRAAPAIAAPVIPRNSDSESIPLRICREVAGEFFEFTSFFVLSVRRDESRETRVIGVTAYNIYA